uniref:TPR_REGION domain-containing protein n=1 Tax=Heterorhabditis bacteriophora TaxID=37862 RepID=A0A1I7WD65_HETBA
MTCFRTHEEFQKSIQNWYDLADMQFKRGCIDLAIEANAQALKFCKDRFVDYLRNGDRYMKVLIS